jgi:hypothetical protein
MTTALFVPPEPAPTYRYLGISADRWRKLGRAKLEAQRIRCIKYTDLYDGKVPATMMSGESRQLFKRLMQEARTNWCELVVNAVAERLAVQGFSFGDPDIDALVWDIWQASHMDADSEMVQTDALVCANSTCGVWPDEDNPLGVTIYPEHPMQITLLYAPGTRRKPVAAYKSVLDIEGEQEVSDTEQEILITPDAAITWFGTWEPVYQPNPTGIVPYVDVIPAPRTIGPPRSELHAAATIQQRINTTTYNRLVATDFGAFRQVTATGVKVKGADGRPVPPFNVGADRLLASENENAKIGVIPESSLRGYIDAVKEDVAALAAITQTPPHYLLGQIVNASGDALKAAESGLVSKVQRRAAHIGEAWEEVARLALGFMGHPGAVNFSAQVIWRDFETRSEGVVVDALTKMAQLGVPRDVLWAKWGASPQDIEAWKAMEPVEPVTVPAAPTGGVQTA